MANGGCWLQDEAWQTAGLDPHDFKRLRAGKRQAWTPMCGLGVPVGCRMKHGKRQAWTPMTDCKGLKVFDSFLRVLGV